MKRRRRIGDLLPFGSLALAAVLAAVVLPSALRPPPEAQPASSAFSPDAPPEEQQDAIVQSLRQAASRTAGATGDDGPPTTTTTIPVVEKPSRGQCFGDPPRQVEVLYSAPCRAAFVGDNGGATWRNVTAEEIRVAMWHPLVVLSEGEISATPPPGESAERRTLRVLQQYLNENYEFYGRRLQIVYLESPEDTEPAHRATAIRADEEWGVFASIYLYPGYCDEMARRQLVAFCNNLASSFFEQRQPYLWALLPDFGVTDSLSAEYLCKNIVGRKASFAGDTAYQQMERRIGVLVNSDQNLTAGHTAAEVEALINAECGFDAVVTTIDYDVASDSGLASVATAMARFRQDQITTVYLSGTGTDWSVILGLADSNAYLPEWFSPGQWAMDWNSFAQYVPQEQASHMFGIGIHEIAMPPDDTACARAYRTIDPNAAPDLNTCLMFFHDMIALANGLQEAGPNLTPESIRNGLFAMGRREFPDQTWAMGGGFGPGDLTWVDTAGEQWWDPNAVDPESGRLGAWRWTHNGRRYAKGEWPTDGGAQLFKEGITQPL